MMYNVFRPDTFSRLSLVALLFVLLPSALALGQRGIFTVGLSQSVNYLPDSDSIRAFRLSNNAGAEGISSLGSEISIGYEWFPGEDLVDNAGAPSVQLVAGFVQRGYRVTMTTNDSCLLSSVYRSGASWLRLGLYGRHHFPIGRRSFAVVQLGATYGSLLSAFDNVGAVQFCNIPSESVEPVHAADFIEMGGGVGIRQKIGMALIGNLDLLYHYPLSLTPSERRPATRDNARSLIVDAATPNLAVTIGIGYMF